MAVEQPCACHPRHRGAPHPAPVCGAGVRQEPGERASTVPGPAATALRPGGCVSPRQGSARDSRTETAPLHGKDAEGRDGTGRPMAGARHSGHGQVLRRGPSGTGGEQ